MEQLEQFYNNLPPELQEKIGMLEPEEQQQVLMELIQRQQNGQSEYAQMGANLQREKVPVEAERNETITVQDGQKPNVEGGYLKELSRNPVTGQATYEIPDNQHNNTHDEIGNGSGTTGVNMHLKEGDVVNSDKTKIPANMIIMGRNFKGKTFKDASDFISKKENDIQKEYEKNIKKGKVDKVSESSTTLMLAKLGNHRNQLNELQELSLSHKEKKENGMKMGGSVYAESGTKVGERIPYILDFQMPNLKSDDLSAGKPSPKLPDNVKDRMVNTYHAPYPVIQAEDGFNTSYAKFKNFVNMAESNPNATAKDMGSYGKLSGFSGYNSEPANISLDSTDIQAGKISKPPKEIMNKILTSATDSGIDPTMMLTFADIESGFKSNAISGKGATGIFQFTTLTGKDYGLFQDGKDKRFDPNANIEAAMKLTQNNIKILQKKGIEINPTNVYLAHQLGAGGVIDIYNNIKTGQPLSKQTKDHMGFNFGTKTALDYIAKTQKEIMSKYKSFESFLGKVKENNDYEAFDLKQKYSLGEPVSDISNELLRSGKDNVMKKLKSGDFTVTTPQVNNQPTPENAQPDMPQENQDMPQDTSYERFGGAIKAQIGTSVNGNDALKAKNAQILNYLLRGQFWNNPYGNHIIKRQQSNESDSPFPVQELPEVTITADRPGIPDQILPEVVITAPRMGIPDQVLDNVVITADRIKKAEEAKGITTTPPVLPINNTAPTGGPATGGSATVTTPATTTTPKVTTTPPSGTPKTGATWLDRLRYGAREAMPYLDNIRLMREETISPVLQQKPYYNPYEGMSTDYSIQSSLNDIDRTTLTAMADERGNPSVRSARLAQMSANAVSSKAPLYTQKYNMEQQMKAQKQLGEMQYLNQWSDANMALAKQYEQEVLKTREIQRQQQHAAIEKIQNDILRKEEQNRMMELGLADTVYDYNKYTGKLELNPEKQKNEFAYRQATYGSDSAEAKKWKKKYEALKAKKDDEDLKYGGSIKTRKTLSLKNYK